MLFCAIPIARTSNVFNGASLIEEGHWECISLWQGANSFFSSHHQYFTRFKFHPSEVVHQVVAFALSIFVKSGHVFKAKILFRQEVAIHFFLVVVFSHYFEQDGAIAMEDFIG